MYLKSKESRFIGFCSGKLVACFYIKSQRAKLFFHPTSAFDISMYSSRFSYIGPTTWQHAPQHLQFKISLYGKICII